MDFLRQLDDALREVLSANGFDGSNFEYRRQRGVVTSCLMVQKHSSDPRCCVELGVHLSFLPAAGGGGVIPHSEMTVMHCEVRKRLTPSDTDADYWWSFADPGAPQSVVDTLVSRGLPFFAGLEEFPGIWSQLSVADLQAGAFIEQLPGMTRVRAALLLARCHAFLGNKTACRQFAAYGLEIAPPLASGPKKALRDLVALE